jgi:hypothetical protein
VDGGIIFGFDNNTPEVFDRTIEALKKIRIDSVAANIPYPSTEFYRKLEREGRIICTDYTKYSGGRVIVRPKNMTVEQLQAGYNRFTKDYYRMMEIVYRAFKQLNAVATITMLIANVRHRMNCEPSRKPRRPPRRRMRARSESERRYGIEQKGRQPRAE